MISVQAFNQLNRVLEQKTGISLAKNKRDIVGSRLSSRLRATQCESYNEYYHFIISEKGSNELSTFIDKMTTHETYFFREASQFEFLLSYLKDKPPKRFPIRAWSAASSTGEEAYSIAMILEDLFYNHSWHVYGTDISETTIAMAQEALFAISTVSKVPKKYKKSYCLKGYGVHDGSFSVTKQIKSNCTFSVDNLLAPSTLDYSFDIIFLRNVLIYFDETKQLKILNNVIKRLNHAGLLFLGHSESLRYKRDDLKMLQPCIYKKISP
ncbi:chemotaxis protein methyltransferase CheR [Pseudoalteromonas citrea]|uniref:Chemotaxis protein methyltransferase n=2 Tax=Pseudoalteromonas citrea TaxID=43655 RepID=A0AAD4AKB1_9GAMM|nr:CheR family methyltransferase [Pseudoalteromonas citrea]KAF7773824.1 chemotaxis protein methyltransferase CheR [Pseudoalteromonas citrea]